MSSTFYPFGFAGMYESKIDQATPVKDTWYTVLDTTSNARLYSIGFAIADTSEKINVKITADDTEISFTPYYADTLVPADTEEECILFILSTGLYIAWSISSAFYPMNVDCRSLKVEICKTTENGTGNLRACVAYSKYQ